MVHSRVNKWFIFCFEFLEADVDHLLILELSFAFLILKLDFFKNLILLAERRRQKKHKNKARKENVDHLLTLQRAKCGPLIEPTTYMLYICSLGCHRCGCDKQRA